MRNEEKKGDTLLDEISTKVLKDRMDDFRVGEFARVVVNDEFVFDGPGVNIPSISISRYPYPEYHTSDDNPEIITLERLQESRDLVLQIISVVDRDYRPRRKFKGPLFLSRFGLWVDWRDNWELNRNIDSIILNLEGDKSVFEISKELDMDFETVHEFLENLHSKGLIEKEL